MAKKTKNAAPAAQPQQVEIAGLNMRMATFRCIGLTPYVQNSFSKEAMQAMIDKQELGSEQAKQNKVKPPKDFKALYEGAFHRSYEGWIGIPANGLQQALNRACGLAGLVMKTAKGSIQVQADGFDAADNMPLIRITKGEPSQQFHRVNVGQNQPDIRTRPAWKAGWEFKPRIEYDASLYTVEQITTLLYRAGAQVGLGEGRPMSKESCGCGWGKFKPAEASA